LIFPEKPFIFIPENNSRKSHSKLTEGKKVATLKRNIPDSSLQSNSNQPSDSGGDPKPFLEAGTKAYNEQRYDVALTNYKKALALTPHDAKILAKVGTAYYKLRDFPNAINHFSQALEIDPQNRDYLFNLGMIYSKSGDKIKALSMYDRLKKIHPEKAEELYKAIYS